MSSDPKDKEARELRVEHVHAALNQITELVSQVRGALEGLDPKQVLRTESADAINVPQPRYTVGQCKLPEPDPRSNPKSKANPNADPRPRPRSKPKSEPKP